MLSEFLVKLTRMTRGKGTRPIEFSGIQTEVQSINSDGKPEFTSPRKAKDGEEQAEPEPIMVPIALDKLPDSAVVLKGIYDILQNDAEKLTRAFCKFYNALAFQIEVDRTATVVEDLLSPVFAELGITDDAVVTKMRRAVSTMYSALYAADATPAVQAEKKIEILRAIVAQSRS